MGLEVSLDGKVIHQATFAVCHRLRSATSTNEKRMIEFSFVAPRAITWNGYLDEDNTTNVGAKLEADIWQAGADPDALILGLSFDSSNQIYMNTVHIARIDRSSQSEVEPGLVVRTYPIPNKSTVRTK